MFEAIFALLSSCLDAPQGEEGFPSAGVDLALRR
jgi:hypothetical protein